MRWSVDFWLLAFWLVVGLSVGRSVNGLVLACWLVSCLIGRLFG